MKRITGPLKKRRARSTERDPSTGRRTGPSAGLRIETEMPLDAEDVALASLEAKVRAQEAMADLSPTESFTGLTVRLPRGMILRLQARAAERNVTPSKLVELALAQLLPPERARRRRR